MTEPEPAPPPRRLKHTPDCDTVGGGACSTPDECLEWTAIHAQDPGRVEQQVIADLAKLGDLEQGTRGSLAEIAKTLARALDRADDDEDLGKVAQVSLQLRQTLTALSSVNQDASLLKQFYEWMGQAV